MTGLEQTFYIMGIVFMGLMFLLMLAIVVAVFVIRAKINKIHNMIEERINMLTSLAEKGGQLSALAGAAIAKKVKKAVSR